MTWAEPLTAASIDRDEHTYDVIVVDANRQRVAGVRCIVNLTARTGYYGEMRIDDDSGGPKQTLRALVLMTREALRHAADLGIQHVRTDAPPKMRAFAARLTGMDGDDDLQGQRYRFMGELAPIRTKTLEVSDADGNLE